MKKTYTIYVVRDDMEFIPSTLLALMSKSFAEGAMAMAETFFSKYHHLICKCDQTDEVLSEINSRW